MRKEINVGILAIGNLGLLGSLSLKSIRNLGSKKIHAMADQPGRIWLQKQVKKLNLEVEFYEPPVEIAKKLDGFESENYSKFGEAKFFQLMYLKWILIESALKSDPDIDFLIFTDLDVLWNHSLEDCVDDIFSQADTSVAGQLDWNSKLDGSSKFLCPGIMIWRNSSTSLMTLEEIRKFHLKKILQNSDFPDDKAINAWMSKDQNVDRITFLSPKEFVIGHRILELLMEKNDFEVRRYRAFHANYCKGPARKILRIKLVSLSTNHKSFRFVALFIIFTEMVITRLIRTHEGHVRGFLRRKL